MIQIPDISNPSCQSTAGYLSSGSFFTITYTSIHPPVQQSPLPHLFTLHIHLPLSKSVLSFVLPSHFTPSAQAHAATTHSADKADTLASPLPNPQYTPNKTHVRKSSHSDPSSLLDRACISFAGPRVSIPWSLGPANRIAVSLPRVYVSMNSVQ